MPTANRVHYAWIICFACSLLLFCTSGLSVNAFSIFLPYILQLNGYTNAQVSFLVTLRNLAALLALLFVSRYYRFFTIRNGVTAAGFLLSAGFIVYGFASRYAAYCAASFFVGIGYGLGTIVPVAILLHRWFNEKYALAFGICGASTGLSTLGIPSLLSSCIARFGLSATFLGEAAVIAVLICICWILLRESPECMGCTAYGAAAANRKKCPAKTPRTLRKEQWLLLIPMVLAVGAVTNVAYSNLSVLASGEGFDTRVISLMLTFTGVCIMLSKYLYGYLSSRLPVHICNWIFFVFLVSGLGLTPYIKGSMILLFTATGLFSLGLGMTATGLTIWAKELSGEYQFERTNQIFQLLYSAGSLLLSPLPGLLADRSGGSYVPCYIVFLLCALFFFSVIQLELHRCRETSRRRLRQSAVPQFASGRGK